MIDIQNYLRINLVDMVMVLISTLLIVLIARKYFWNVIKDYISKRHDIIEGQLKDAQEKSEASHRLYMDTKDELRRARLKASEIIEAAQSQAQLQAEKIIEDAQTRAGQMIDSARQDIYREQIEAAEKIKSHIGDIAIAAAKAIVEKEVDESVHRKYVKEFIDEAGDALWEA